MKIMRFFFAVATAMLLLSTFASVSGCFSRYDLNKDGKVDLKDVAICAKYFASVYGEQRYNEIADVNDDGVVNIVDLTLIVAHFSPARAQVETSIDIDPDTLNLKSNGKWITAYIELTKEYAIADVDVNSILLNGTFSVAAGSPTTIGDYDADNVPDLMVKFDRASIIEWIGTLDFGDDTGKSYDVELAVSGNVSGAQFTGSDITRVLKT